MASAPQKLPTDDVHERPTSHSLRIEPAHTRAAGAPVYQPIVNVLPLPTGPLVDPAYDNITNPCLANLTAAYLDPSVINATSVRVDHSIAGKINLPAFGTYLCWKFRSAIHAC
jgi:hypothetical protein